jgi:hypothetical protein
MELVVVDFENSLWQGSPSFGAKAFPLHLRETFLRAALAESPLFLRLG